MKKRLCKKEIFSYSFCFIFSIIFKDIRENKFPPVLVPLWSRLKVYDQYNVLIVDIHFKVAVLR